MQGTLVTPAVSLSTPLPSSKPTAACSALALQDQGRWSQGWTRGHGLEEGHVPRCHVGTYFQKTSLALTQPVVPDAFCNTQPRQVTTTVTATATIPHVLTFLLPAKPLQRETNCPVLIWHLSPQHPTLGLDPATLPARGPPTLQISAFQGASQDQGRGLWKEEPR